MSTKEACHIVSDCKLPLPRYQVIAKNSDVCQLWKISPTCMETSATAKYLLEYLPEQKELKSGSAGPVCRSGVSFPAELPVMGISLLFAPFCGTVRAAFNILDLTRSMDVISMDAVTLI